jgi:hypothetical protein
MVMFFAHQFMKERNIDYQTAVGMLDAEKIRILAEGARRAIRNLASGEEVQGRAMQALAFKAFKAHLEGYDENEPEDFESYLLERLGHVKSAGAISEIKFMFQVLEFYEQRGQREFVEMLFSKRDNFAKFTKAIPVIRARMNELRSAEQHIGEAVKSIDEQIRTTNDDDVRDELLAQKEEMTEHHEKVMEALEANVTDTLKLAQTLALDPTIDATGENGMVKALSRVTRGEDPHLRKLPVPKFLFEKNVVYMISVAVGLPEQMVERAIGDFADVFNADPKYALAQFKPLLAAGD